MQNTLLIATKNPAKVIEITSFLSDLPIKTVSLKDLNISDDVEEDGRDYWENSKKKAVYYSRIANLPAIADDGGLEISALNGAPGVKSRRWLGYHAEDEELIEYMKKVAHGLPDDNRTAYFKDVVTLALPTGALFQEYGKVKGIIAKKPLLKFLEGYPYRSFFYLPEAKKYYHESDLSDQEMVKYNHRLVAINKMKKNIRKVFDVK